MTTYLVAYDKIPGETYDAVEQKLASFSEGFHEIDNFWIVSSNLIISDLRDVLAKLLPEGSKLMVMKYVPHNSMEMGAAAWHGFDVPQEGWLAARL
ncbi:hypothetical protein [Asaia krungthepensis]|uniref:SinR family protein n=1 Tax=Asaia krungthepensis NRIC 0535 TaxID=1307925 RepID=A0ABQ0Q1H4_9PROT|nr:hypothetical protein [Asaia krungthepensis]GBQ86833.1 hypothetical protein AA0535_1123 [Asaia krungthepensis NRIC 0535]